MQAERPSDRAIAQAFFEIAACALSAKILILKRAREIDAQGVPESWRWVPVEPTEAMVDAGNDGAAPYMVNARDLWAQMIAAAPSPSVGDSL